MSEVVRVWLWWLWQRGCSQREIVRRLGVSSSVVSGVLREHGGIAPAGRRRDRRELDLAEREEISRGLAAEQSQAAIARGLGRHESTISREITRNGGKEAYRAQQAEQAAWDRARRPKPSKFAGRARLAGVVEDWLSRWRFSPPQIAARLRRAYPDDPEMRVSHETIYRSLYLQTRGSLRHELTQYLRRRRSLRSPGSRHTQGRGHIPDKVMLAQRPAEADDRAVPGHWEGDLILGAGNSAIATLVERHSRYTHLIALPHGRGVDQVTHALSTSMQRLPDTLKRSLTWDQGKEMSHHPHFTIATGIPVYFCPPGTPWLRGSNENTNRLIREFLPKGTNLTHHTQTDLDHIATLLNTRPRKTLNWNNPTEQLTLALTT